MGAFERITVITPAADGRNAKHGGVAEWRTKGMRTDDGTSHTNYGIIACDLIMVLKGELGAVQFRAMTRWFPPHVQVERGLDNYFTPQRIGPSSYGDSEYINLDPMGSDVGYHSPMPMYEGQATMGECQYSPTGECYYDGSSLRGSEWVEKYLLKGGSEAVWEALERDYHSRFDEHRDEIHALTLTYERARAASKI
jgi:hypothetical protein